MRSSYRELLIQLRSLLHSGVPIKEALASIPAGRHGSLARSLLQAVDSGQTLGEALETRPDLVSPEHAALVDAGERSGRLVEVLDSVISDLDGLIEARRFLLQQAAYPALVLAIALVLPPFSLWAFRGSMPDFLPFNMVILVLAVAVGLLFWKGPRLFPRGSAPRRWVEQLTFSIPVLRSMVADSVLGRALVLEGMLLEAGLGFEESLPLVRRTVTWELIGQEIDAAQDAIRQGDTASDSFRRLSGLPAGVAARLEAAEKAGELDVALRKTGEEMRQRVRHRLQIGLRILPIVFYLLAAIIILRMGLDVLQKWYTP